MASGNDALRQLDYWEDPHCGFRRLRDWAVRYAVECAALPGVRDDAGHLCDTVSRCTALEWTALQCTFSRGLYEAARGENSFECAVNLFQRGVVAAIARDRSALGANASTCDRAEMMSVGASLLGEPRLVRRLRADRMGLAGRVLREGRRISCEQALRTTLADALLDERDQRDPRGPARARTWRRVLALLEELAGDRARSLTRLDDELSRRLLALAAERFPQDRNLPRTTVTLQAYVDDFGPAARRVDAEDVSLLEVASPLDFDTEQLLDALELEEPRLARVMELWLFETAQRGGDPRATDEVRHLREEIRAEFGLSDGALRRQLARAARRFKEALLAAVRETEGA